MLQDLPFFISSEWQAEVTQSQLQLQIREDASPAGRALLGMGAHPGPQTLAVGMPTEGNQNWCHPAPCTPQLREQNQSSMKTSLSPPV